MQARRRDRAAADAPAPDREPGAARCALAREHRRRARSTPTSFAAPGGELRARAARDDAADLGRRAAQPRGELLAGAASPPKSPRQRRDRARAACRGRGSEAERAFCAARELRAAGVFAAVRRRRRHPAFQLHVPLIDHGALRRRAGRRVLDRGAAALLRAAPRSTQRHTDRGARRQRPLLASTRACAHARAAPRAGRRSWYECRSRRPTTAWCCAARAIAPRSA